MPIKIIGGNVTYRQPGVAFSGLNLVQVVNLSQFDGKIKLGGSENFSSIVVEEISPGTGELKAFSWGINDYYQLGFDSLSPAQLTPSNFRPFTSGPFVVFSLGRFNSAVITKTGYINSWGLIKVFSGIPRWMFDNEGNFYAPSGSFRDVACGNLHRLALGSRGDVWGWGANDNFQLTNYVMSYYPPESRVSIKGYSNNRTNARIYAYGNINYLLNNDGTVECWRDREGWHNPPHQLSGNFVDFSPGGDCMIGLMTDGTVLLSGDNIYGALGNNTTTSSNNSVLAGGHSEFISVFAGGNHCAAVKADGSAWTWGDNRFGQLGNNTTNSTSSPVSVVGGHVFSKIYATKYSTYALKSDGSIWVWGSNTYGQLGDGTTINKSSPISISRVINL